MATNAFLVLRSAMQTHKPLLMVLGAALGVAALALLAAAYSRSEQLARSTSAPSGRLIAFTASGMVLAGLAGLLAVLH